MPSIFRFKASKGRSGQLPFLLAEPPRYSGGRSMRAVKGRLGHSFQERYGKIKVLVRRAQSEAVPGHPALRESSFQREGARQYCELEREQFEIECSFDEPGEGKSCDAEGTGHQHKSLVGPGVPQVVSERQKDRDDRELSRLYSQVETHQAQRQRSLR